MAVPVPKGDDFGRRKLSRRTLVTAVVFVLYLVLGGLVFGRLEVYEKERMVLRPTPAWRALQAYLNRTGGGSADGPPLAQTGDISTPPGAAESQAESESESESWSVLKVAALADCDSDAAADIGSLLDAAVAGNDSSLEAAVELCGRNGLETITELVEVNWSFIDAFFFCMTVITTIGYGHISPSSAGGQIFCIVYSMLGIPISGLLLAGLSDFFAGNLLNFYDSKWQQKWGESRWSLAGFTALYLLVGFLLFVFAPAVVFTWLEGWSYRESVYYAFITLSTIGFGDYTAAIANDDAWASVYKVFVMLWVLVGLGYWVLVLNFLQKAIKSKEVVAGLRQTSKLIAKEAEDIRQALADAGILQRDAVFVPERSKMTMSLMMNMSSMLAGGAQQPDGEGGGEGEAPVAARGELRGIHSMGANLRSNSLLSALMASLPAGAAPPPETAEQTPSLQQAALPASAAPCSASAAPCSASADRGAALPTSAERVAVLAPLLEQPEQESPV